MANGIGAPFQVGSGGGVSSDVNIAKVGGSAFALGQQLATASIPVVLTAAQMTTLTPVTDTQYVDAVAAAAHPTGTGIIFNNAGTYNFVSVAQPLPVTGSLTVGGTTDNSAFAANTSTGTPSMGFFHSTIDAVTDGHAAALAIDAKRNLFVVIRDAAGNARGLNIDSSGQLAVAQATAANLNATVVGTGTFAVQATPVTQADTFMLGGVNIKEINAITPLMGNGITGTGSLRVTIASDNTSFPIKLQDGSGTSITSTTGALDVNIKSGASSGTQYTDAVAAPAHPIGDAIIYNNAGTNAAVSKAQPFPIVLTDASNSSQVSLTNGSVPVFINDNTNTGTITANAQQVTNSTTGDAGASILITGTWVGTLQFEGSQDGSTFAQIPVIDMATGNTVTSTTGNSSYRLNVGGLSQIQVRSSAWTSGTATIKLRCGPGVTPPTALPTGANIIGKVTTDQTTHGTTDLVAADITKVGGAAVALGQTTMTASIPVVLASNQASIPVAATLAAETTKVIGTVNQGTSPWVVSNGGTFAVQATLQTQTDTTMVGGVNIKEINAITPLMGNGLTGTGSLRVTIASDNTAFAVNATLSAETTKVIGTVNIAASQTIAVTNTGTFAAQATLQTQTDTTMVGGVNIKEINAITPLMGNGLTGTGSLRVTIASDNTAFAVNATLSAETTKVIGTVNIASSQTIAVTNTGTFAVQATPVTQADTFMLGGVNIKEINAITPLMGNGNTGTGSLRVTIAADNTAFAVNATLSAETTKVIGVVRNADGAGNLLTSNSTATSLKFGLDTNILSILGTAPTTAGKLDVKGADGDVFVRQATGTNLHVVTDSGTITTVSTVTAVTAISNALPAGTNLLGKVGIDQTTVGTTNAVSLAQIGATTVATGNGIVGAGVQRVAIASDNTAFAVNATLSAETTKVIGTVNQGTSPWVVSNGGTFAVQATLQTQTDTTMIGGVNVKEINGVAPLMGVGATGTGAQRIVLANDAGKTLVSTGGSASSSGNNTLIAAGTNRLKVYAFTLSTVSTTAVTCIFQSGASGTELWRVVLQTPASVAGGANLVVQPPAWLFATGTATLLNLNLSAAVAVNWSVSYFDEA